MRQTFEERTWKAWAETSREGRRGVDAWRCGTSFYRYQAFLTLRLWQIVEAKSKTMGCWVRSRPLLLTCRMVSFSFSTIDYKSLTYARGFAAYNSFCPDKNSLSTQSDDRQPLILRQVDSRGLDLTQQPIVLLFASTICHKPRVKKA